jgi:hypothetical protein
VGQFEFGTSHNIWAVTLWNMNARADVFSCEEAARFRASSLAAEDQPCEIALSTSSNAASEWPLVNVST